MNKTNRWNIPLSTIIPITLNKQQMKQITIEFLKDTYTQLYHTIPSYNQTEEYREYVQLYKTILQDLTTEHEFKEFEEEL